MSLSVGSKKKMDEMLTAMEVSDEEQLLISPELPITTTKNAAKSKGPVIVFIP